MKSHTCASGYLIVKQWHPYQYNSHYGQLLVRVFLLFLVRRLVPYCGKLEVCSHCHKGSFLIRLAFSALPYVMDI